MPCVAHTHIIYKSFYHHLFILLFFACSAHRIWIEKKVPPTKRPSNTHLFDVDWLWFVVVGANHRSIPLFAVVHAYSILFRVIIVCYYRHVGCCLRVLGAAPSLLSTFPNCGRDWRWWHETYTHTHRHAASAVWLGSGSPFSVGVSMSRAHFMHAYWIIHCNRLGRSIHSFIYRHGRMVKRVCEWTTTL